MIAINFKHLLVPEVRQVKILGTCVRVTLKARSVGPATGSHELAVNVPYTQHRSLLDHAKYAWECALAGAFPSSTQDCDALKELATNRGEWSRVHFSPFTPSHMQGPTSVSWDMFASTLSVHGRLLGEVRDEVFDWNVDCAVLTGDVPLDSLPVGDLDLGGSFSGTLMGSRVADSSILAEAIREVAGENVQGTIPSDSMPPNFVRSDNVVSLHASKITPPATWTTISLSKLPTLDTLPGTASTESLPFGGLQIGRGISMSCARGVVSPDQVPAGVVLGRHVISVGGDRISGPLDGALLLDRTLTVSSHVGSVDAGKVEGDLNLPENSVMSTCAVVHGTLLCDAWVGSALLRCGSAVAKSALCTNMDSQHIRTPNDVAVSANASIQRLACEHSGSTSLRCEVAHARQVSANCIFTDQLVSQLLRAGCVRATSSVVCAGTASVRCQILGSRSENARTQATSTDISRSISCGEFLVFDGSAHIRDLRSVCVDCSEDTNTAGHINAHRTISSGMLCRIVAADCLNSESALVVTSGIQAHSVFCQSLHASGCTVSDADVVDDTDCHQAFAQSTECQSLHADRFEAKRLHAQACAVSQTLGASSIRCFGSTDVKGAASTVQAAVHGTARSLTALTRSTCVLNKAVCPEAQTHTLSCTDLCCSSNMEAKGVHAREVKSANCHARCSSASTKSVQARGLVCRNVVLRNDAKARTLTAAQSRSGVLRSRVVNARSGCESWINKLVQARTYLNNISRDI